MTLASGQGSMQPHQMAHRKIVVSLSIFQIFSGSVWSSSQSLPEDLVIVTYTTLSRNPSNDLLTKDGLMYYNLATKARCK